MSDALSRRTMLTGSAAVLGLSGSNAFAARRNDGFVYAAQGGTVAAFRIDRVTGKLSFINAQSVGGKFPVHVTGDPSNRFLLTANGSSLSVLPRRTDGSIAPLSDVVTLQGVPGPHRNEQKQARAHHVTFDPAGRFAISADKGCDAVRSFSLDDTGKLTLRQTLSLRESSGPRHVAFHPSGRFAYIANDLNSTVTACRYDADTGALTPMQILSAVPDSYMGNGGASEVAVSADGRFVHATHRGANSSGIFAIDARSGRLTAQGFAAAGPSPRRAVFTASI